MASKITLKNNQQKELSIINRDNTGAKTIYGDQLVMSVDTIADMEAITTGVLDTSYDGTTCIVKADGGRNGTFVYSFAEVANDNQGTNFNGWVRQYDGAVNVKWFGALCNGTDEGSILLAITAAGFTHIDVTGLTIGTTTIVAQDNITLTGTLLTIDATGSLKFTGDYLDISIAKIVGTTTGQGIWLVGSNNSRVYNTTFSGSFGHCLVVSISENISINNNIFLGTQGSTCVSIESCLNVEVGSNVIRNHTGFGIQTLFSSNINISNTIVENTVGLVSVTATHTQAVYTITLDKAYARLGVIINDDNGQRAVETVSALNVLGVYTITLADTTVTGSGTLEVYYSDSLESIQVNSGCSNINITGGTLKGTGDANIVVGADYHYDGSTWVLDAPNAVESDFSTNIKINGVSCSNSISSNIAINSVRGTCEITNCTGENAGKSYDANKVNDCSFNVARATLVSNNTAISSGYTRAGFVIVSTQSNFISSKGDTNTSLLSGNIIRGSFKESKYKFLTIAGQDYRSTGVKLEGNSIEHFNFKEEFDVGSPMTSNDYYTWNQYANNLGKNSSDNLYGTSCLDVNGLLIGAVNSEIGLLYYEIFINSVVKVSFYAKKIAGTSNEVIVDF